MASIEVKFGSDLLRRESAYERDMTSLLLVDMQRIWCEPNLDPTHPQDADSYYHRRLRDLVVPNQKRILDAARAAECNILHTIIQSLTNDGRDRSLDHKLSDMHVPKDAPEGQ